MSNKLFILEQLVATTRGQFPSWRVGQAWFNCATHIFPKAAELARGNPNLDPFHRNDNLDAFIQHLENIGE